MALEKMESSVQLLLLVLLSGLMLVCRIAEGDTHYYDFVLKDTNFTRLCVTKTMLTVNESFPGPVVYVHTGDTAIINVQNEGSHGVTIHWHGVKQPRNPWSDGPDHITQCQIQPGTSFTQKVIFSEDQEGTLWWHAHSDWTRATVHGAIVVLPAEGTTYPFPQPDGEEVIVLACWYDADQNAELEYDLIHYEATTPESDAYTINGFPGDLVACSSVNHIASTLNNISFMDPSSSILDAYYRHISGVYTTDFPDDPPSFFDFTGEDDLPSAITKPATKVKVLNYNETLEIVFQGTNLLLSAEDHPVHLHGFTFFVVGMGFGNFDPVADPKGYNLVDPPEQNTVRVPKNGWVAIRLRVDNPGVWLWHCHLDRHFTWGMATVFIVKDGGTPETSLLPPPDYMPPCTTPSPIRLEDFNDADGVVNTIILPAEGTTYPYPKPDAEEVIVLASWFEGDVNLLVQEALLQNSTSSTPVSDAYTINGQPGDFAACSNGTTYRLLVDYGKTYLLRIVNAIMNSETFFAISGHNLTVVGTDGTYTKPFVTSFIMITPGQTMDVLVTMDQAPSYYYMAARQFVSENPEVPDFDDSNVTAIIQYRGNYTPPAAPSFPANLPAYHQLGVAYSFLSQFRSLASPEHPVNVPLDITTRMYITVAMNSVVYEDEGTTGTYIASSLNNISFLNPEMDVLQAYYRHVGGVYTTDFPDHPSYYFNFTGYDMPSDVTMQATKVKVLNYNESAEIIFQGTNVQYTPEDHPLHLHGYTFYVIGSGYGVFDNETDPQGFNLVDPPERNTVTVPQNGWVALRFVANNPGVWLWHCHLDRHLTLGMDTVFIVKDGGTPETSILPPPAYMPPCQDPSPIVLEDFSDSVKAW
ncbi:hypothetical protein VitviT2T_028410 [Vitis vinifera]|uniref:laccase n=1 Tax=Vitis vinifera TaxID=29760 RepID=A0ABY9DVA5_VITVI|nr:hypothetical protein VitviT2T_028410 [Vitis vinifera]